MRAASSMRAMTQIEIHFIAGPAPWWNHRPLALPSQSYTSTNTIEQPALARAGGNLNGYGARVAGPPKISALVRRL